MLLNTAGVEFVTRREAELERELTTLGTANLLSSALGGYVNCMSLSRTTLNYAAGGRGRLCGLTVAVAATLMLVADPSFLVVAILVAASSLVYWLLKRISQALASALSLDPSESDKTNQVGFWTAGTLRPTQPRSLR